MNKHLISAIIFLMTLSLLGIIGFQLFWINHALQLKEEQFDRQVNDALKKVVEKLETHEAVDVITDQIKEIHLTQSETAPAEEILSEPKTNRSKPKLVKKSTPASNTIITTTIPAEKKTFTKTLTFPAMQVLDTATLRRLTHLKTIVDTVRLHEHVNQKFVWVQGDSSFRTVYFQDTARRTAFTRGRTLRPASVEKISVHPVKVDTARIKGFRISTDHLVVLNNQLPATQGFFSDQPENRVHIRYSPAAANVMAASPALLTNSTALTAITGNKPVSPTLKIKHPANPEKPKPAAPASKITDQRKKVTAKTNQLTEVVQKMAVEYVRKKLPLEKRLPKSQLDSLVKNELWQAGIHLPFEYAVKQGPHRRQMPIRTVNFSPAETESQYAIRLFPNDIYIEPNYLTLQFPDRNAYLLHSFRYLMGFSALFTLIMLSTFLVTVHTILKQKKISEIKNDFINNMTHEFKTPLATISLAVDAIANPKILDNKDRVKKYAGIIRDENKRMHQQVENVLQMALLDKQELKLNLQTVALHPLILQAAQNMHLLLESKAGNIQLDLAATDPEVLADEAHLGNVIGNLLDNAIKYSVAPPEITITTTGGQGCVHLTVTDKGMGMSRDTQHRIFDKFYRVSTGNLHPVKGFGLGLAYVKAIVLAHNGQISVKSEVGRGSSFQIILPLIKPA